MQLPAVLLARYATPEYDGTGVTELLRADFEATTLRLSCKAYSYEDGPGIEPLPIRISFQNVIKHRLCEQWWDYFFEEREHVQLVPYQYPRSELYLRNAPKDVDAAYVQCIRALLHVQLGKHDPLQVLGFTASSFLSRLEAGFGKVVEGPAIYLDQLASLLKQHNAGPSTLPLKPLRRSCYYTEDDSYGSEPYDLAQLRVVRFGQNWVVTDGTVEVTVAAA